MKTSIFLVGLFMLAGFTVAAQDEDTSYFAYDSAYVVSDIEDIEDIDTTYEATDLGESYTIDDPAQLPVTQQHHRDRYPRKDFNKANWKEIVGDTDYTEEKKEEEEESSGISSPIWNPAFLRILGFAFIIVLAIAILYFLVKSAFDDGASDKKLQNADSLLSDDMHIDHVNEQDIDNLLKQALAANDFRAAVRLYYIRLLKHLNNVKYISWKRDKTNRDYTFELSSTSVVPDFKKVTLAYEIIWYGERTPTLQEFEDLQKNFNDLHSKTASLS